MTIGLKYIGLKYYGLAIETLRSLHSKPELLGICRCIVESTSRGSEVQTRTEAGLREWSLRFRLPIFCGELSEDNRVQTASIV